MKYWTCSKCGANLDFGEKCDCEENEHEEGKNTYSGKEDYSK